MEVIMKEGTKSPDTYPVFNYFTYRAVLSLQLKLNKGYWAAKLVARNMD
jgi:hypothetical protein